MRVGISAYLLHGGGGYRAAGVSIYTHQLLRYLPEVCPGHEYLAYLGRTAPALAGVKARISPVPAERPAVRIAWEQVGLPLQLLSSRPDVLHGTVNVVPLLAAVPTVVTVHDLSFLRHPDRFPRARVAYLRVAVSLSARRASRLIAVSRHTGRDLTELLHVPPERISVVYSGVDPSFHPLPTERSGRLRRELFAGRPYILHVGTLEPRKNVDVLIRAYARVRKSLGLDHVLALVGARGWMFEPLFALVRELDLEEHVRFLDYVDPEHLPLWYNGADLFVYPSAYEGFGLPVLEAMACGTPVVTSASSALQELADGACLTVEPGSEEDLYVAIARLVESEALRKEKRQAGLQRASLFTWDRTARETVAVYEGVRGYLPA